LDEFSATEGGELAEVVESETEGAGAGAGFEAWVRVGEEISVRVD
jgi:hypothetical protein